MSSLGLWHRAELGKLKKDMDELFDTLVRDFCSPVDLRLLRCEPDVRVVSEADAVVVTAHVPCLDPTTLKVTVSDRRMTVTGEKVETFEGQGSLGVSRQSFASTVRLSCPVQADQVSVRYVDGRLRIVLPRVRPGGSVRVNVDKSKHEEGTHE